MRRGPFLIGKRYLVLVSLGLWLTGSGLFGEIKLPSVLGSHMVFQQEQPIKLWGWADPGETVSITFAGQTGETSANKDGRWMLTLPALKAANTPYTMTIDGSRSSSVRLDDILIGEVWLCSGQSNMQWALASTFSPRPEILRADFPSLRLFQVPREVAVHPQSNVQAEWKRCRPETVEGFSAVAYYFGRMLHLELGIPVGLIHSSWGGTRIEPWTPPAGFQSIPELAGVTEEVETGHAIYRQRMEASLPDLEEWLTDVKVALRDGQDPPPPAELPQHPNMNNRTPTVLYNGMIHALTPFAIRGAIWYQGEANRNDGPIYTRKMEALINGWRTVWNVGDFPFYYVQLAPFNYAVSAGDDGLDTPDAFRLPLIWEAQLDALRINNTGMAVITDITNLNDIHPRNKKEVGRRLALWALAKTYSWKELVYSGPLYKSMSVEGKRIRLAFDHIGDGLVSLNRQPLTWFEIAGPTRTFYKARAEIQGDTVIVWSEKVPSPVAVRFGWHQLAVPNLGNSAGLPASPFRTDRW